MQNHFFSFFLGHKEMQMELKQLLSSFPSRPRKFSNFNIVVLHRMVKKLSLEGYPWVSPSIKWEYSVM